MGVNFVIQILPEAVQSTAVVAQMLVLNPTTQPTGLSGCAGSARGTRVVSDPMVASALRVNGGEFCFVSAKNTLSKTLILKTHFCNIEMQFFISYLHR
jgi:hypothetical protein